jgi:hypothetical protein
MYIDIKDPSQHVWYLGKKYIFSFPKFRPQVSVRELYEDDVDIIKEGIELFTSEIQWAGMFDLETALDRLKKGHRMFVLLDGESVLGYTWFNDDYLYNFYVNRKRVYGDSQDFCNYVCKLIDKDIRLFVVVPNETGHKFFSRLGFERTENE